MPPRLTRVLETVLYYRAGEREAVERFYGEVLALRRVGDFPVYRLGEGLVLLFDAEETRIQDDPPPHGASGPVHTCFVSEPDEYEAWKARLAAHGVRVTREIVWPSGVRSFYFDDPAGNVLEIADGDLWPG